MTAGAADRPVERGSLSRNQKKINAAVWLAEQGAYIGWSLIIHGKDVTRPWKSDMTDDPGKVPGLVGLGTRNALIVPAGRMVILDPDKHGGYDRLVAAGLPDTFRVETPTARPVPGSADGEAYHGLHVYGLAPDGYDVLSLPGVYIDGEVRRSDHGEQSMALGPWAMREDGIYTPVDGAPRVLAVYPAELLDYLKANPARRPGPTNGTAQGEWVWDATMGSRHDYLRDRIRFWRGTGLVGQPLRDLVSRHIEEHRIPLERAGADPDLDADEIERMCAGAERKFGTDLPTPRVVFNFNGTSTSTPSTGATTTTTSPPNLPAAFWEARPALTKIRDAAWYRQRSPDAFFAGVLTRVAASLPHTIALPPIVGTPAGTGLIAAVLSPSGVGKTTGAGITDEVLVGGIEVKTIPGGTGEGMVEAYFEMVEIDHPTVAGKKVKVRKQAWHNLNIYIDEITKTLSVGKRDGATVNEMFRQAFSGSTLGEHNASAERRRVVAKGEYAIGILIAAQPHVLGPLFDDADAGTPTRFVFLSGIDPSVPETPPAWPGTIDISLPPGWNVTLAGDSTRIGAWRHHVTVDKAVADEIRARDLIKVRGGGDGDPWTGHRDLVRLKVAFVLAVLDHRVDIRVSDWELAGMVVDTSDAVRKHAQSVIAAAIGRTETAAAVRQGDRATVVANRLEENTIERLARRITRRALAEPGALSISDVKRGLASTERALGDDAIAYARERKWLDVRTEPGQGSDKERLYPGTEPMPK